MARKPKTDFEILHKVSLLDDELFKVLDHTPRKFQFNKEQYIKNALSEAVQLLMDSLYTDPRIRGLAEEKVFLLDRSLSKLKYCEYEVFRMNGKDAFSDDVAARIMELLNDVYGDYDRLLSSLRKKYLHIGSDIPRCDAGGVLSEIRTADCGTEGGSDA